VNAAGKGLPRQAGPTYRMPMGMPVPWRLMFFLAAAAFMLAAALPGTAPAMSMPNGTMIAGSSGQPCDDCPDKPSSSHPGAKMMPCGALACAGVVAAVPIPLTLEEPFSTGFEYPAQASATQSSVALPPDPFPPRPFLLS
jgi:hypothetical protein